MWFWNRRFDRQKLLSFWVTFCPFSPLTTRKIKMLKLKKETGDITILHICTINDYHTMNGSWDLEWDRQNFLSFWNAFCPFTPLWTQKKKILKKRKKRLEILSFYTSLPLMTITWCMVAELWSVTYKIFYHFGPIFALLPP